MKEKSTIVGLPVVPYNQSKLADVCQYLDYLQDFISSLSSSEVVMSLLKVFKTETCKQSENTSAKPSTLPLVQSFFFLFFSLPLLKKPTPQIPF